MLPPSESAALQAVKKVQVLNGPSLEKRVRQEVGDPLLAMFALLAKNLAPQSSDQEVAKMVHLMVLAYLIRSEVGGEAKPPPAKKP